MLITKGEKGGACRSHEGKRAREIERQRRHAPVSGMRLRVRRWTVIKCFGERDSAASVVETAKKFREGFESPWADSGSHHGARFAGKPSDSNLSPEKQGMLVIF